MRLSWTAALAAVVLLLAPLAQASFEISPTNCRANNFRWATSCYPAATEADGYKFGNQKGLTLKGAQYFRTNATIAGAAPYDLLYNRECAAKEIKITVPVPTKGVYQVTLLEAEIYFTKPQEDYPTGCPRVFTICTDDYMTYNDICLYKYGVNKAIPLVKTWYIDDGSIDMHLWSSVNMPKLGGVIVRGMDCTGDARLLRTASNVSDECTNAAKGIYAPVGSPKMPGAPGTNATANGTTNGTTDGMSPAAPGANGTTDGMSPAAPGADATASPAPDATMSPAPVGPVLPAGPPVTIQTTRDLPKLNGSKAALATSVSQFANDGTPFQVLGAPDGTAWPTEATAPEGSTATAHFAVPVSPKDVVLAGNFTKGDKVNVTVSGPGADGMVVSRDIALTAAANGTALPVPVPKGTTAKPTPVVVDAVTVALPTGSTAKIDAIKLDGTFAPAALTNQQTQDNSTGAITQWPISAADSAGSPGLGGAGTGSVFAPDGTVWAPAGTGTQNLTLNYTTPVNATTLLLAAAPKAGATVDVMGNPADGSAPIMLYTGPASGGHTAAAPGTYGLYPLPLTSAMNPLLSSVTVSTADPKALALDSAALVGPPKALDDGTIPMLFPSGTAADGTTPATGDGSAGSAGSPGASGSRGVTLPIADGEGEWASGATSGAAVLPDSGTVPEGTIAGAGTGPDATNATGVPDGKTFAIPASAARGLPAGATPYLSLDYPNGKKANVLSVAGKAVAPGTLRASVVDTDGKITDLGAQALPTPADVNTYVNFTTPNNDIINVKQVILTPTPANSFLTDAVELNTASAAALGGSSRDGTLKTKKRHHHRDGMHHRINGSRGAWIAVVTICTIVGFILCCCCLPYFLYPRLAGKKSGATTVKDTTGGYAGATAGKTTTTSGVTSSSQV